MKFGCLLVIGHSADEQKYVTSKTTASEILVEIYFLGLIAKCSLSFLRDRTCLLMTELSHSLTFSTHFCSGVHNRTSSFLKY